MVELINSNITRTKVNVNTGGGENIPMVLCQYPSGGKWIEGNAGNIVYRWDPASNAWRDVSNPSMPLQLKITPYVEEKVDVDELAIPKADEKTVRVVYGSTTYENARLVSISDGSAVIYDEGGNRINQ